MEGVVEGKSTVEYTHDDQCKSTTPLPARTPHPEPGAFKRKHAAMQEAMTSKMARTLDDTAAEIVRVLHETHASEKARSALVELLRQDAAQMHGNEKSREALTGTAGVFALNAVLGRQRIAEVIASGIIHAAGVSAKIELKLGSPDSAKTKASSKRTKDAKG